MKCGARVALGVVGGYFLGRTRKMKLALALGGMAMGRRAGGPAGLLAQGGKLLGSSPELSRLTDEVRGRLLEAGKGAALAVAARQVESLTDRVGKRVESLGSVGAQAGGTSRGATNGRDAGDEYEDAEEPERESEDGAEDTAEEEPERPAPRQRANASGGRARGPGAASGAAKRASAAGGQARRTASRAAAGSGRGTKRGGGNG